MTGHTPWSEIVHKRRRWVHAGFADRYIDTLGMYASVSAIEVWSRGLIVSPKMYDQILTGIARRKAKGCRPWKIAR